MLEKLGKLYICFFLEELSGIGNLQYWGILGICDGFMEFLRVHIVATLAMIPRSKLFAFFFLSSQMLSLMWRYIMHVDLQLQLYCWNYRNLFQLE